MNYSNYKQKIQIYMDISQASPDCAKYQRYIFY